MPVYFCRVQEKRFFKSDRISNIMTKAKCPKKHVWEVMCTCYEYVDCRRSEYFSPR